MYKPAKRFLDLIIAFSAVLILSPLFLIVIVVLLFSAEHQVFFFQKRVGYQSRFFHIWKFATMVKNSPNMGTGEITLRNDPRVTPVGKFLRATKINELPQIINVLKGEMSIVGPRPLMEVSYKLYSEEQGKAIYQSKPGITGIGSLIFRDEEKILSESADPRQTYNLIYPYKAQLELWYKQNATLWLDIQIIFLTAWVIIFPQSQLINRFFKNLPIRPAFQ